MESHASSRIACQLSISDVERPLRTPTSRLNDHPITPDFRDSSEPVRHVYIYIHMCVCVSFDFSGGSLEQREEALRAMKV